MHRSSEVLSMLTCSLEQQRDPLKDLEKLREKLEQ